jgi:SAM-dependent methyltransferase
MDRRAWLDERRAAVEADYTTDAPTYEVGNYPISDTHRRFVARVVDACPQRGVVLDIPCGTGRYFELVAGQGRRVVGSDQSAGMAAQARQRGIAERVDGIGLQELADVATFDGVMCIDAMEHVPPEDWPIVLGNLVRAVRRDGLLYVSLEVLVDEEAAVERAYAEATAQGFPVVRGESVGDETGGYHYYPTVAQVQAWVEAEGLVIVEDTTDMAYGDWGYRHLLLRHGS